MTIQSTPAVGQDVGERPEELQADTFGRNPSGPLAGLLVADFSRVLAGPYCTMLLADMGATVVKIESPAGDETRTWKPPLRDGESTYYLSINRNKSSIALDLENEDDRLTALEIASRADIIVENFKPRGLERFGLHYESVAEVNPGVIYASITGFGTAGGANLPGYDLLVQALSGLMNLTGSPESEAYRAGVAVFDVMTGLHASIGILAALEARRRNGAGQHVEVNLMSSALSGMVNQTAGYVLSGQVPVRMGNEHPSIYPYEPIPTGNGDIVIAIGNDRQFRTLCKSLGNEELSNDARFSTAHQRSLNRSDLRPLLQELLSKRSSSEWFELLTESRIPCAPINDVSQGIDFAERIGLDPVVQVGAGDDSLPGIRNPISFSDTPVSYDLVPPNLDGQRESILHWLQSNPTKAKS